MEGLQLFGASSVAIIVLLSILVCVNGAFQFTVLLQSYSNPSNKLVDNSCCDEQIEPCTLLGCDPYYDEFCLRFIGTSHSDWTSCTLGQNTVDVHYHPAAVHIYSPQAWPGSFQLYILMKDDDDFSEADTLARVFAEGELSVGSDYTDVAYYTGNYVTLGMQFRVVCSNDLCGDDCTYVVCSEQTGETSSNGDNSSVRTPGNNRTMVYTEPMETSAVIETMSPGGSSTGGSQTLAVAVGTVVAIVCLCLLSLGIGLGAAFICFKRQQQKTNDDYVVYAVPSTGDLGRSDRIVHPEEGHLSLIPTSGQVVTVEEFQHAEYEVPLNRHCSSKTKRLTNEDHRSNINQRKSNISYQLRSTVDTATPHDGSPPEEMTEGYMYDNDEDMPQKPNMSYQMRPTVDTAIPHDGSPPEEMTEGYMYDNDEDMPQKPNMSYQMRPTVDTVAHDGSPIATDVKYN